MAQNVTIAGAAYSSVPAINVPKTGGGTAKFVDTTDADAAAADIAKNKTAYVAGVKVVGTAEGGKPEQSKTLTLGAAAPSTVTPDSGKVLSSVPVVLDTSVIKAANIAKGVTMLGIQGAHEGGGGGGEMVTLTIKENGPPPIYSNCYANGESGPIAITAKGTYQVKRNSLLIMNEVSTNMDTITGGTRLYYSLSDAAYYITDDAVLTIYD